MYWEVNCFKNSNVYFYAMFSIIPFKTLGKTLTLKGDMLVLLLFEDESFTFKGAHDGVFSKTCSEQSAAARILKGRVNFFTCMIYLQN